jgi:hypothetical protein
MLTFSSMRRLGLPNLTTYIFWNIIFLTVYDAEVFEKNSHTYRAHNSLDAIWRLDYVKYVQYVCLALIV